MELGFELVSDVPAIPAQVPGSTLAALLAAGWVEDWNVGLNSLRCEWVEHRHWEFIAEIEAGEIPVGEPVVLCAEGLDYSGWILVDRQIAGLFKGALRRHQIDLTSCLSDGKRHEISILFDEPPPEQGQAGFTSKSQYFKPRYNYGWDWCPRVVPIGIWDGVRLEIGARHAEVIKVQAGVVNDQGIVTAFIVCNDAPLDAEVAIFDAEREIAQTRQHLCSGDNEVVLEVPGVNLWWPNGEGAQPLYSVQITAGGQLLAKVRVGFKTVRWLPCENAPKEALPWICEVNGRPIFLQGVNWTPIKLDYHSVQPEDYRHLISLYREMGCNTLRVWGGGFLERKVFYDLCDEAGLLVWQEFPLSSSGPDNWPPEAPEAIDELCRIARDYIRRRGHHACKLLWCGGNELQHEEGKKTGAGIPIDSDHPCMAALSQVVQEEDPGVRFVPTSSSGPRFMANASEFGLGLHHDVHGPWNLDSRTMADLAAWEGYWANDDALLRSETGMPGASSLELIERYCGQYNPWPPSVENPYWQHSSSWWVQWDRLRGELAGLQERDGLGKYIELSQELQAQALRIAANACRVRFPKCGGILIWMGHDAYPCAANTALIDFEGNPKPAYFAVRDCFNARG